MYNISLAVVETGSKADLFHTEPRCMSTKLFTSTEHQEVFAHKWIEEIQQVKRRKLNEHKAIQERTCLQPGESALMACVGGIPEMFVEKQDFNAILTWESRSDESDPNMPHVQRLGKVSLSVGHLVNSKWEVSIEPQSGS